MTRIEKLKRIRHLLANAAGEALAYQSRTAEEAERNLLGLNRGIRTQLLPVTLMGLTSSEADELDFGKWDEAGTLRLAPIWLYPFLNPGDELDSISGKHVIVGEHYWNPDIEIGYVDNDVRFGYLAFGVKVS